MKKVIIRTLLTIVTIIVLFISYLVYLNHYFSVVSEGEQILSYNTPNAALLVIDVQESTTGTLSLNDTYSSQSGKLIENINKLTTIAKERSMPVIFIRNETTNWLVNLLDGSVEKGSPGADLDKRLSVANDFIFAKWRLDAFCNPSLDSLLIKNKINKLFVTGLDAAYCVNNTIEAAQNRGYEITVIEDALASETDSLKQIKLDDFKNKNIRVIELNDF